MNTYNQIILILSAILIGSCVQRNHEFVASGSFEAEDYLVSSENAGKIVWMNAELGQIVKEGDLLAIIDTTNLYLKKQQMEASIAGLKERMPDVQAQLAATREQINSLTYEQERLKKLVEANAANQKQLDDVTAQLNIAKKQENALTISLTSNKDGIYNDIISMYAQYKQVQDQLERSYIKAPINGSIIMRYAKSSELVTPGKPIVKIADLSSMYLRVYLTAQQLESFKIGDSVTIYTEVEENKFKQYPGCIEWISAQAEFTPKNIQTRDERENLVYATRIRFKNDGYARIGMYGEIRK